MEVDASCSSSRHYPHEIDQLLEAFGSAFSIEYIASTYLQANRNIDMASEMLCELQASAASIVSQQHSIVAEDDSKVVDMGVSGKVSVVTEFSTKTSPNTTHQDLDEFLFKMLGQGFELPREVIHEVLSACGYDMEKSMEVLLDKSASTLKKSDDILSNEPEALTENFEEMIDISCRGKSQQKRSSKKKNKVKNDLEKELLQSLFTASQIPEQEPKKSLRHMINRPGRFGRVVNKPLEDTPIAHKTLYVTPLQPSKDEDEEDNFHVYGQAVKEHFTTMKEYYKAACEAFLQGDHARAGRLMEQGHFFRKKARELGKMSFQHIVETREEEVMFDFSDLEPKESAQQLMSQLTCYCGIQSIPCIKVKLGNGEGGGKEASRRKRLILKLLEKELIKWTEIENGNMISIQVGEIKPESLSFFKR